MGGPFRSFGIRVVAYPPVPTSTKSCPVTRNKLKRVVIDPALFAGIPILITEPCAIGVVNGILRSISSHTWPVTVTERYAMTLNN